VTSECHREIAANIERAEQSIAAAKELAVSGFHDFAASRAYYAAFYASTAALLSEGIELSKHSGVIAFVHQRQVKTGKIDKEQGQEAELAFRIARCRRLRSYSPRIARGCGNGYRSCRRVPICHQILPSRRLKVRTVSTRSA